MKVSKLLIVALLSVPAAANATVIYSNDFGGGLGAFQTSGGAGLRVSNGESYLGGLTTGAKGAVSINTAGFANFTVSFSLYAIQSLDGDGPSGGGVDPFTVDQGTTTLFNYTFANYSGASGQSYPVAGSAPGTGAAACGQLGFGCGDFGDRTYNIAPISFFSTGNTTVLTFTGLSNQGEGDESYGIDNIVVSGTAVAGAVPETATWAMMVGGFGAMGTALRRRRKLAVSSL